MPAELNFPLRLCRLSLRARAPLTLPIPASNRFRGALGFRLPEPLFRPTAAQGPSGFHDPPRPFTLRAHPLNGRSFQAGELFPLELHLFGVPSAPFRQAFETLPWATLAGWQEQDLLLDLAPAPEPISRLRVHFETPTELKPPIPPGQLPEFAHLAARLRDRLSALRTYYGPGPFDLDFAAFSQRAQAVETRAGELVHHSEVRTSARTGQTHPLGGITGWVDYEGPLAEFLPWLRAAAYTGVGRHTVWGHGILAVEAGPRLAPTAPPGSATPPPASPSPAAPPPAPGGTRR